jgi:hypothetical protein
MARMERPVLGSAQRSKEASQKEANELGSGVEICCVSRARLSISVAK